MTNIDYNYIVAIDLGSSHLAGMVAKKDKLGKISIVTYETEKSSSYMRRGCIYNVEQASFHINSLIRKLENKLNGAKIKQVYIGIGGQSLHTIDNVISHHVGGFVTEETIEFLNKKCSLYRPELTDVLATVPPVFYLDGKLELEPIGVSCLGIEARYKQIVGFPALRKAIKASIEGKQSKLKVANVLVSPLVLAEVMLTKNEITQGCAFVNFGGGVTSLSIYKNQHLVSLQVIPLGSHLITKDLASVLKITEAEAERIKQLSGYAVLDKKNETTIQVRTIDEQTTKEVKQSLLNQIIEARIKEIVENICVRIEASHSIHSLDAGIIIAGGGASLKNLSGLLRERLKMDVRYALIRKDILNGAEDVAYNQDFSVVIGMLANKLVSENCIEESSLKNSLLPKEEKKETFVEESPSLSSETVISEKNSQEEEPPVIQKDEKKPEDFIPQKKKGSGLFGSLSKKIKNIGELDLFSEEE